MKNNQFNIYYFLLALLLASIAHQQLFAQHQNPTVVDINDGASGAFSNTGGEIFIPNGTGATNFGNVIIYSAIKTGSTNDFELGYFYPATSVTGDAGFWRQAGTQGSIWIPSTAMTPTYSLGDLGTLGITASTEASLDIRSGTSSSNPRNFVNSTNGLFIYFLADKSATEDGIIHRFRPIISSNLDDFDDKTGGNASFLTLVNDNTLFLSRNDGAATEQELWNATASNFTSLVDLLEINNANNGGTYPENLIEFNNQLFFAGFGGNQITIDGANINNSSYFWVYDPSSAISPNGFTQDNTVFAYSTANDATNNPRFINIPAFAPTRTTNTEPNNIIAKFERGGQDYLVVAQKTPLTTDQVDNLYLIRPDFSTSTLPGGPYTLNPNTDELVAVGTKVFFTFGANLYVFDGEAEAITNITMISPGLTNPNNLGAVGDRLFLSGGGSSNQLYMSDGGSATLVATLPAVIANMTGVNDKAYFTVGNDGAVLYHSDGTDAGTGEHAAGVNYDQVDHINPYIYETTAGDNQEALVYVANNTTVGRGIELHYARPCPEYELQYALSDFCSASGTESPSLTFVNGDAEAFDGSSFDTSTGTYASSPAGLSMNAGTGDIDVGVSSVGTYTITYTAEWNGCTITASTEVTISSGTTFPTTFQIQNTAINVGDFLGNSASPTVPPVGMAVSPDNNTLYFSDVNNNRVRALNLGTNTVSNFYAGGGSFSPSGIITDNDGNVYVGTAESTGNQIYKFDASGTLLNGPTPPSIDTDHIIMDLALDYQNNVYVLLFDNSSGNKEIQRVGSDGVLRAAVNDNLGTLLSIGAGVVLSSLAIDPAGNFYVAGKNNRVYKINATGSTLITTYDGTSNFDIPIDIAVNPFGEVFVVNNNDHQINKIATDGTISVVAGTGSAGTTNGADAASAQLTNPSGIAIDKQGGYYIADNLGADSRIRRLFEGNFAGNASADQYVVCSGDNVNFTLTDRTGTSAGWEKLTYDSSSEQWISQNITGASDILNNQTITETTIYRALVSSGGFCPGPSNYALVTVRSPEQPADIFIGVSGTVEGSYCKDVSPNPTITATGLSGYKFYQENVTDATAPTEVADNATGNYTVNLSSLDADKTYRFYAGSNGAGACAGDPTAGLPSVTINVFAKPADATFPNAPHSICGTGDVILTANGASGAEQYIWYDDAGGTTVLKTSTDAADATFTITGIAATRDYYVAISNGICTGDIQSVTVTVNPIPTDPTFSGAPFTRCGAGDVTLTASGAGAGEEYVWYDASDAVIVGETGATYTATGLAVGDTDFKVAIKNSTTNCESGQITTTVTVSDVPADPTFDGAPFVGCDGEDVTLTATGAGVGEEYVWYDASDVVIVGETGATYTATGLAVGDTDFKVAIRNSTTGCESGIVTTTVTVSAIPADPGIVGAPFERCGTGDITLEASGAGAGEEYVWYDASDVVIAGETGATYTATGLSATTNFSVAIKNTTTVCESGKVAVTATIHPDPTPVIRVANQRVCLGDSPTYEVDVPTAGNTYNWEITGGGTIVASGALTHGGVDVTTIDVNWTTAGNYTIRLTEVDGTTTCQNATPVELAVEVLDLADPTIAEVGGGTVFCQNNQVTLQVYGGVADANHTYTWEVENMAHAANVTLNQNVDNPAQAFVFWKDDTDDVASAEVSIKVIVSVNGTGCEKEATFAPTDITPSPNPTLSGDIQVCENESITYTNTTPGAPNSAWRIEPSTAGVFAGASTNVTSVDITWNEINVVSETALVIVTETAGNGCALSDTLEVVIADYLSTTATAGYRCDATTPGQIQVKALSENAQSFKFYDAATGGNDVTASFTALNDSIFLTPLLSTTTNYWVTAVNINDCENATRTMVTAEVLGMNRPPSIDSTITNTCLRANTGAINIQVDANAELQLPFDYILTDESGGQIFSGASTDGIISLTGLGIGNYTVSITDNGGCFYNEVYPIVLDTTQSVAVDLGENLVIEAGRPFALEVITDAEIVSYSWTPVEFFNDPTLASPEVTLDTITTVYVEVETVEGCVGSDSVTLDATSFNLYIPNTFSPNEDGSNDRLQIFGEYIESLDFKVFDRIGNLVFSSSSVDEMVCFDDFGGCSNGWDGKDTSGKELPPGNYVWQITGNFVGGIPLRADNKTSGNVLIIR